MDVDKLEREVKEMLAGEVGERSYSEIREELIGKGYNQHELRYIMGLVDEKLLAKADQGGQGRIAKRNMILGGILSVTGLLIILTSYFGNQAPKEVYYVALVAFAVGYLIFRNGFRRRDT